MMNLRNNPSYDQRELELKVQINNESTFYLNCFPNSFANLRKMIQEKKNNEVKITKVNMQIYYYDDDNEKICLNDDTDLGILLKRLVSSEISRFKIHADFSNKGGKDKSLSEINIKNEKKDIFNKSKISKFCDFLIKNNKQFDSNFKKAIHKGKLPCLECLGTGKDHLNSQCANCYGFGERPKDKKWNLILKLIEFKFNELLLIPFQKLCYGFQNEEEEEEIESNYNNNSINTDEESSEESGVEEIRSESTIFKEIKETHIKKELINSTNFQCSENQRKNIMASNSTVLPSRKYPASYNTSTLSSNTLVNQMGIFSSTDRRNRIRLDEICSTPNETLSNLTKEEQCINLLKTYMPKNRFKEDKLSFDVMRDQDSIKNYSHHSHQMKSPPKISLVRLRSSQQRGQGKPPKTVKNLRKSKKLISKKLITFKSVNIEEDQDIILKKSNPEITLEIKNTDSFSWPKFTEVKLCDQNYEVVQTKEIPNDVSPGEIISCKLRFDDLSKVRSTMLLLLKWRNGDSELCYQSQWVKLKFKKI